MNIRSSIAFLIIMAYLGFQIYAIEHKSDMVTNIIMQLQQIVTIIAYHYYKKSTD